MQKSLGTVIITGVASLAFGIFAGPQPAAAQQLPCGLSAWPSGAFTIYVNESAQWKTNPGYSTSTIYSEQANGQANMSALRPGGGFYSSAGTPSGTGNINQTTEIDELSVGPVSTAISASGPIVPSTPVESSIVGLTINTSNCTMLLTFRYVLAGSDTTTYENTGTVVTASGDWLGGPDTFGYPEPFACDPSVYGQPIPFSGQTSGQVQCAYKYPYDPGFATGSLTLSWSLSPLSKSCDVSKAVFPFAGGDKSIDGLSTSMLATFSPSTSDNPMTVLQAATGCNYLEFDWRQAVVKSPVPLPAGVAVPVQDPPKNGWPYMLSDPVTYASFLPPSQTFPYYYNPTLLSTGCAINTLKQGCNLRITSSDGRALNFFDMPAVKGGGMPAGESFGFITSLVGVRADGTAGDPLFTWTWESTYSETTQTGGVQDVQIVQTASSIPASPGGTGGVTITSINGVAQTLPTVTCTATPTTLWPPNGGLAPVTLSGTMSQGTQPLMSSDYVVADSYNQLHPSGSVTLDTAGNYSFQVPLIAARNGNDSNGRTYTVAVMGRDSIGNTGTCSTVITVPHDQGQN